MNREQKSKRSFPRNSRRGEVLKNQQVLKRRVGRVGGGRCLQRSSSPAAASNCTSLSHIDLISSCLASCAQGLWDDWKQKMHCSVIGLPLNKACHMTTLTYTVTVSRAPLIVRAPTTKAACARPATAEPPGPNRSEPHAGQRVETRLPRRPLLVCFPPAWMPLVRPAARHSRHHEAFKYNYGLFSFCKCSKNAEPSKAELLAQMCGHKYTFQQQAVDAASVQRQEEPLVAANHPIIRIQSFICHFYFSNTFDCYNNGLILHLIFS